MGGPSGGNGVPRLRATAVVRLLMTTWATLDRVAKRGICGPIVYDALHAETARQWDGERIVTSNKPHFDLVADGIRVEALELPAAQAAS